MRGRVPESPRVCRPGWQWDLTKPRAVGVDGEGQVGRWRVGSGAAGLPLRPLAAAGRVAGHGGVYSGRLFPEKLLYWASRDGGFRQAPVLHSVCAFWKLPPAPR